MAKDYIGKFCLLCCSEGQSIVTRRDVGTFILREKSMRDTIQLTHLSGNTKCHTLKPSKVGVRCETVLLATLVAPCARDILPLTAFLLSATFTHI